MSNSYMWIVPVLVLCGLVLAFLIYRSRGGSAKKQCGYCRSWVKYSAAHCPKCGYEFIIG